MSYKTSLIIVLLLFGTLSAQVVLASNSTHTSQNGNIKTEGPSGVNQSQPDHSVYLPILSFMPPSTVYGIELLSISQTQMNYTTQLGASWIRRNAILWEQVEAQKGQRDWSVLASLERELIRASEQGVQIILIIRSTPIWAQKVPGSPCGPILSTEFDTFADFVNEAVKRYSNPPYNVKYWEIGNEPDMPIVQYEIPYGCWGDSEADYYGGGYYADMIKIVYPKVKAANPEAQVLIGGLLMSCDPNNPPLDINGYPKDCSMSNYLEGILDNGGASAFDGISFHAYDYYQYGPGMYSNSDWNSAWNTTGPCMVAKMNFIKGVLNRYGATDKFLMNTETGLLCSSNCGEMFEKTKTNYLVQVYTLSSVYGIRATVWYDLYGSWRHSGLMYSDNTPRPAYYAYQFNRRELGRASFLQDLSDEDVVVYEFNRNGQRIWVLWSKDGEAHTEDLASTPSAIYDVLGNPLNVDTHVPVDASPLYIEW